jgi:hypothetical protein
VDGAEFIEARHGYAERTARWAANRLAKHATAIWGWKDPRNCLTLPIWLSIYPGARVLHIIRDGRAVALSLADRDSLDPDFGLSLWALHVERTEAALATLPDERQHTIRYEDLMADPGETLRGVFEFAGLPLDDVDKIAGAADSSRVGARREDPRTARFARHPLLNRYGYDKAPSQG